MCLGIPGRIVKIDDVAKKLATVDVSGVKRQINIACIVNEQHPVESQHPLQVRGLQTF